MSDQPENLILVLLRRLDTSIGDLRADFADVKHRLTAPEIQVATKSRHYASLAFRLDRIEGRFDRRG